MTLKKFTGYGIFTLMGAGLVYVMYQTGILLIFLMLAGVVFGLLGLLALATWLITDQTRPINRHDVVKYKNKKAPE